MYKLVAFTGAGISKASGVPTFEEMGDLREKLSRDYINSNPYDFYQILLKLKGASDNAKPNPAHLALSEYHIPIITMNIDGLHRRAGSDHLIEIHGNMEYVYCPKCGHHYDYNDVKKSYLCPTCNVVLQPNVVLYGDDIPNFYDAIELIDNTEALLVVGTSFYTSTAYNIVGYAKSRGVKVTIINENAEVKVKEFLDYLFKN